MREIFNKTCTECQSPNIMYDEHKGELFCNHCGLILDSIYENIKIIDYIKENNQQRNNIADINLTPKYII